MIGAREAAFRSLLKCEQNGSYTNLEIDSKIKKSGLEGVEKSLYTTLVYGVTERQIALDYRLSRLTRGDWSALAPEVRTILRLGGYQILYLDRIPESAAVNESTGLARRFAPRGAHNLVNAVLRQLCRSKEDFTLPEDRIDALSVSYSVPRALIEIWESSYGREKTAAILEATFCRPRVTLRVNTLKNTADELISKLSERSVKAGKGRVDGAVVLDASASVADMLDLIEDGSCFVQDASSQTAVKMLAPKAGELIVDACACPGGKSFSSAVEMQGVGEIHSFDLHKSKLPLIEKGAKKLGIEIITAAERDARNPDAALLGRCDRVVCDVPCSGLGVIAKKPEIRYKDLSDIGRLPEIQYDILCASAGYLRPGGRILYSTCTINSAENEKIAERFVGEHPEYRLVEQRTFFPTPENDGFFAAIIEKNDNRDSE
ncbi:MAG: 16S rRNA (cytosine(967)-C(5))-methyltransferase RsmB [Clostridia bacterium]|nr:16S rRNA (cytosine(967)-C(5))-methyltransferase RsmB [Clostridia bacterium]